MSETTLHRPNNDRIVLRRSGGSWRVAYYCATRLRGGWLRRLFGRPALFRGQASTPAQVQALLVERGVHLSRGEVQRLNALMNRQEAQNNASRSRSV